MSLYHAMPPVKRTCPECFNGRTPDLAICVRCDGIGRIWLDGGPSFGCKLTLGSRKRGEVVTLGNGDRGRVVGHSKRGPTTTIALIDELFDQESDEYTEYPSETGVRSTMPALAVQDDEAGQAKSRRDQVDPLQRENALWQSAKTPTSA